MAEPLRGAAHRLHPARVSESRPRPWRTTPAPHPGSLLRVLPPGAYSPLARQGCAPRPANRAAGTRQGHPDSRSRWPPPSLRPTGRLIQLSRFATISPVLPSGCSRPTPKRSASFSGGPTHLLAAPPVYSLLAFLGLSREHRPSSTEWDEVLAKDRRCGNDSASSRPDNGNFSMLLARRAHGDLHVLPEMGQELHQALDRKHPRPVAHQR